MSTATINLDEALDALEELLTFLKEYEEMHQLKSFLDEHETAVEGKLAVTVDSGLQRSVKTFTLSPQQLQLMVSEAPLDLRARVTKFGLYSLRETLDVFERLRGIASEYLKLEIKNV